MKKNYPKILEKIVSWMQHILKETHTNGFVYGVSGGIDSGLICAISAKYFKENSLALRMDLYNQKVDINDANLVVSHFNAKNVHIHLENVYDTFLKALPHDQTLAQINLKARLRMATLYYYAQTYNYLVCGTSNAAELYVGYFTKFGDSGCDFAPLANLTKQDVYECAKLLGMPKAIMEKKPTAGLYPGQTDEADLKITYKEIDQFLNNKTNNIDRIMQLHESSIHKRNRFYTILPFGEVMKDQ